MASQAPPKPWTYQQNSSESSLASRGMEVSTPPGQEPPSPNQYREMGASTSPVEDRYRTRNRVANTISAQQRADSLQPVSGWSSSAGTSSQVSPRSSYRQEQGLEMRPQSMSKTSARKVQQLTGYESRHEKVFPVQAVQTAQYPQAFNNISSLNGSDSEGSVYSQSRPSIRNEDSYNSAKTQSSERSMSQQRAHTISKLQHNAAPSAEDIIALQQILVEQQQRYDEEIQKEMAAFIPRPLVIHSKKPKRISILSSAPSILKNARDSLEWGINELTSPRPPRTKRHNNTPVKARFSMHSGNTTPEEMPPSPLPKSPRRKKFKNVFGTGEHPLKSPYPFPGKEEDDTITSPSESKFGRRLSGAVKSLSTGRRGSQTKKTVITNKARKADGPDTPTPVKSSFVETMQKGNEQLHDIIEKTKKSVLKSSDEKRREELKKKIHVVGLGDQSPGPYP
ncbi:uncharacterized protein PAC_00803 [Phialocephala subalpina]|uniref:Uncharacterized protein n=1 Tax=Phialocephala subalpina TaxID=576137 RepID=A0A1L7WDY3_9HELO|nr:uncharacterized protein PAC_00803 [Phialocephala subalpina]